jgi:hypothetical protein
MDEIFALTPPETLQGGDASTQSLLFEYACHNEDSLMQEKRNEMLSEIFPSWEGVKLRNTEL